MEIFPLNKLVYQNAERIYYNEVFQLILMLNIKIFDVSEQNIKLKCIKTIFSNTNGNNKCNFFKRKFPYFSLMKVLFKNMQIIMKYFM